MKAFISRGKPLLASEDAWVQGFLLVQRDAAGVEHTYIIRQTGSEDPEKTEVVPDSIGICTGLQDSTGTDIFTGDIVAVPAQERICGFQKEETVRYNKGGFYPFAIPGWEIVVTASECKIVGNTFDQKSVP